MPCNQIKTGISESPVIEQQLEAAEHQEMEAKQELPSDKPSLRCRQSTVDMT